MSLSIEPGPESLDNPGREEYMRRPHELYVLVKLRQDTPEERRTTIDRIEAMPPMHGIRVTRVRSVLDMFQTGYHIFVFAQADGDATVGDYLTALRRTGEVVEVRPLLDLE